MGPTCDMVSGQCLNCQNNTFGFECQLCLDGYYGDVSNGIPCKGRKVEYNFWIISIVDTIYLV